MLFNSNEFLFLFFPLTLACFFALARIGSLQAAGFLALASLVFYGWWDLRVVPLLLASIVFNYWAGAMLAPHAGQARGPRATLAAAVAANLALLGVFKYAGFFVDSINQAGPLLGFEPMPVPQLALPSAFRSTPSRKSPSWSMPGKGK